METKTMTREELRIEIAKLQGIETPIWSAFRDPETNAPQMRGHKDGLFALVPDYLRDIAAAWPLLDGTAEWVLSTATDEQARSVRGLIGALCWQEAEEAALPISCAYYERKAGIRVEVSDD